MAQSASELWSAEEIEQRLSGLNLSKIYTRDLKTFYCW